MCDTIDESDGNEELQFADKEWNKLNKSLWKDGYREGAHEGRESGLQKSFDEGFKRSFDPFLTISSLEAIIDVLTFKANSQSKEELKSDLNDMKSKVKILYNLVFTNLIDFDTIDSSGYQFPIQTNQLFNEIRDKTIHFCNKLNFEKTIVQQIEELSVLRINE